MKRADALHSISSQLQGRRLVWFGTRGDDSESAASIPEFKAAFSILASHRRRHTVRSYSIEELSGVRVDLDTYEIDEEPNGEAFATFRKMALRALAGPTAVFTYRPSILVSALCFARRDNCRYLGLFKDFQAAFEHKPWVESSIRALGVPAIPWHYVADEEQLDSLSDLSNGPVMLRRSRSSGGTGLVRVEDFAELQARWPRQAEAYVSVAPYIDGGMPLNVGGVVWRDGVTLHPLSLQLIGQPECTTRPFGYCGNDYSAVQAVDPAVVRQIQAATITIGHWMRAHGYVGAFGVDFLVKDGVALFTEVNPRFQGSTHLSSDISNSMDESCIVLDHLAALLGVDAPPSLDLTDYFDSSSCGHLVVHWTGPSEAHVDGTQLVQKFEDFPRLRRSDVVVRPTVLCQPNSTVARLTFDGSLSTTGFDLDSTIADTVRNWRSAALTAVERKAD